MRPRFAKKAKGWSRRPPPPPPARPVAERPHYLFMNALRGVLRLDPIVDDGDSDSEVRTLLAPQLLSWELQQMQPKHYRTDTF